MTHPLWILPDDDFLPYSLSVIFRNYINTRFFASFYSTSVENGIIYYELEFCKYLKKFRRQPPAGKEIDYAAQFKVSGLEDFCGGKAGLRPAGKPYYRPLSDLLFSTFSLSSIGRKAWWSLYL
jgi:hypothetical protein